VIARSLGGDALGESGTVLVVADGAAPRRGFLRAWP